MQHVVLSLTGACDTCVPALRHDLQASCVKVRHERELIMSEIEDIARGMRNGESKQSMWSQWCCAFSFLPQLLRPCFA